jgi:hypothetical protein
MDINGYRHKNYMVLFDVLEMRRIIEIQLFFVGWAKKGQATFFGACTFVRSRGCRGKQERKDFSSGPAKRVRMRRVVVEGLLDFRRDLEIYRNQHYINSRPFKNLIKRY